MSCRVILYGAKVEGELQRCMLRSLSSLPCKGSAALLKPQAWRVVSIASALQTSPRHMSARRLVVGASASMHKIFDCSTLLGHSIQSASCEVFRKVFKALSPPEGYCRPLAVWGSISKQRCPLWCWFYCRRRLAEKPRRVLPELTWPGEA